MKLFATVEDIRASNATIERNSGTLQSRIHKTLCSATYLFFTGEIDGATYATLVTETVEASPYHRKAAGQWVQELTPLQFSKEKKVFFAHKDAKIKESAWLKARDLPFWKVSPPQQVQPWNLVEDLQRAIAKADKRMEDDKKGTEQDVIPPALVRALKDLVANVPA